MKQAGRVLARQDIRGLLAKPSWTVADLVDRSAELRNPPKLADLTRLAKLAALEPPGEEMLAAFTNQLRFVELLRDVDTTNVEPVTRLIDEVVVASDLESAANAELAGQETEEWDPVSLASEHEGSFYVVKDRLHGAE